MVFGACPVGLVWGSACVLCACTCVRLVKALKDRIWRVSGRPCMGQCVRAMCLHVCALGKGSEGSYLARVR